MSELTEDQKLTKLGFRSPNQTQTAGAEVLEQLKNTIADDFGQFQTDFDTANLSSWADFETWLGNNGFDSTTASNIRTQFEAKYASFSDFKDKLLNQWTTWEDFENSFAANSGLRSDRRNSDGLPAAGIKVYEEGGVGRAGQTIPAGGVEIYGAEVHISGTATVRDTADDSSGASDAIVWDTLFVDPNSAQIGDTVTVEADATNNTSYPATVVADLLVDGAVAEKKTVDISANTTKTVSFTYTAGADGVGTFSIGVSKAGTENVEVVYVGL